MNRKIEQYINKNYDELLTISFKLTDGHQDHQDLLQECLIQLYEGKEIILKGYTNEEIKYYIVAVLKRNWFSKTSRFHYRFRKQLPTTSIESVPELINIVDDEELVYTKNQLFDIIEESFSDLNWFHKSIMSLYLSMGSLKKVSNHTGIPLSSVGGYIKEIRTELKENIYMKIEDKRELGCGCKGNAQPTPQPTPTPVKTN